MPPCYNYKKERKMADIILQARDLCKSFSSEGVQNHVLNNMDLDIYKGDFTVIMGASGSGKSTLLYSLSGMDRPTSGKVIYDGEDITEYNEKRMAELRVYEFGFVFQQIHLVSNLSIRENILVPGYMNKDTRTKETENRADELIKKRPGIPVSVPGYWYFVRRRGTEGRYCQSGHQQSGYPFRG